MSKNLNDLVKGGTFCCSKAGLGVGGTATGVVIAAPNGAGVDFCIEGIMYHKADAATVAITAAAVQAVSTSCLYLVCLDSSGTLSTVKGTAVATSAVTAGDTMLKWPEPTADTCPIGGFRIDTNASTTFTAGTTELSAAGITDTYYDFSFMPTEGLTA